MVRPARALSVAALLAAVAAAPESVRAQQDLEADVRHALDAARPALLAHLRATTRPDGRPGELALLLLAASHDGVDASDAVVERAVHRLAKAKPEQTYDLALRLCVLEAMPTFPDRLALAAADTEQLLRHRDRRGGFGYSEHAGGSDLSNTQYGALGLRAGAALGAAVDRAVWSKLAQGVGDLQDGKGGFAYAKVLRLGADASASMTAAGIAVLAICRQQLGATLPELDSRIQRGWSWFERHVDAIGSPQTRWSYYFHYGLERAAILTDVVDVGGEDWYRRGASMLVAEQLPGGGWRSAFDGHSGSQLDRGRGDAVPTAFAVLFLRRKFQKDLAAVTPQVVRLVNLGPKSPAKDVEVCVQQLVAGGKTVLPDVLQALRSEAEPRRRAAALALQALAGQTLGYDPALGVEANRGAVRAAELWYLRQR
jgi:hypothetical protein